MTLNLTELRDELLDSTPVSALVSTLYCSCWAPVKDDQQVEAVAADDESVFKIDVDALSDEVLDPGYTAAPSRTGHFLPATYQGGCQSPDTVGGYGGGSSDAKSHLMHR